MINFKNHYFAQTMITLTLKIPNYESQNRDPMRPSETQIGFEKKMTFRTLEPQKVL